MSDYSYDQGEDNYYSDLLGRGAGDPDVADPPYTRPDYKELERAKAVIESFAPKPKAGSDENAS